MPPKRTSVKKAPPSGQEQDPVSVQHEVQGDQDHEEPPLNVDDKDISFEVEEHDDTTNLKHEETKGDEERDSSTEDVSDETLFMTCIDDLGIPLQGLNMMTKGQLSDLKELCKMKGHDPKECLMLVSQIMLPLPNLTASSARSSRDLQRRVDKAKADSKSFDQGTIVAISNILREGTISQDFVRLMNEACGFNLQDVVIFSADHYVSDQGSALQVVPLIPRGGSCSTWRSATGISVFNSYGSGFGKSSSWGDDDSSDDDGDTAAGHVSRHRKELLKSQRYVIPNLFDVTARYLGDVMLMPGQLPSLEERMIVANINSVTLGILLENDAISDPFNMALSLLFEQNQTVYNVLIAALSLIKDAWAQMAIGTLKQGARNQNVLASRTMMPSLAVVAALRRRTPPGLAMSSLHQLSQKLPQSDMKLVRRHFSAILRAPAYVAGLGTVIQALQDNVEQGKASIPSSLPDDRADTWNMLFSGRVLLEIVGSALTQASRCPTISHDIKAQYEWGLVSTDVSNFFSKPGASWPGLLAILDGHARLGHCAPGIGYSGTGFDEVDGLALLSQETDADPKREISMQDAGKFLMAHQLEVDGPLFVEERNGKYNLITNDNGDPISLSPGAWRALSNYGKACLYAMRKNHTKRNGLSGDGKTNDKGYKTNARQRTKITAEPEESAPKRQLPPSSLPGLKTMDQSELAEMLKTLKAQSGSMARAQALQAQENARIMSSIGFLTDSLAADEDLGSTD